MKHFQQFLIFCCFLICIGDLNGKENLNEDQLINGSVWQLVRNGSSSPSHGNGQVVYFLISDAHNTYRSRRFQMWDGFSVVDSRNLVRLKKNQKIQVISSNFNKSIYEIKLLEGFYKGKTFYLIAEELEKNFVQEKEDDKNV